MVNVLLEKARMSITEYIEARKDLKRQKAYSESYSGHPVALVIDMQYDFLRSKFSPIDQLIKAQTDVLRYFASNDFPVIATEYNRHGQTINPIRGEIQKCRNKEFISKSDDNGFRDTCLESKLREFGVSHLVLMGVNANSCVWFTAYSGLKKGFQIMTASDLISDGYHEENYRNHFEEN